jgi:hypothetical protein
MQQYRISGLVPVSVVDVFEAIETKHKEGCWLACKANPHQQPFASLEEAATVRNAR